MDTNNTVVLRKVEVDWDNGNKFKFDGHVFETEILDKQYMSIPNNNTVEIGQRLKMNDGKGELDLVESDTLVHPEIGSKEYTIYARDIVTTEYYVVIQE